MTLIIAFLVVLILAKMPVLSFAAIFSGSICILVSIIAFWLDPYFK